MFLASAVKRGIHPPGTLNFNKFSGGWWPLFRTLARNMADWKNPLREIFVRPLYVSTLLAHIGVWLPLASLMHNGCTIQPSFQISGLHGVLDMTSRLPCWRLHHKYRHSTERIINAFHLFKGIYPRKGIYETIVTTGKKRMAEYVWLCDDRLLIATAKSWHLSAKCTVGVFVLTRTGYKL
jgi:hypothetical protein